MYYIYLQSIYNMIYSYIFYSTLGIYGPCHRIQKAVDLSSVRAKRPPEAAAHAEDIYQDGSLEVQTPQFPHLHTSLPQPPSSPLLRNLSSAHSPKIKAIFVAAGVVSFFSNYI